MGLGEEWVDGGPGSGVGRQKTWLYSHEREWKSEVGVGAISRTSQRPGCEEAPGYLFVAVILVETPGSEGYGS